MNVKGWKTHEKLSEMISHEHDLSLWVKIKISNLPDFHRLGIDIMKEFNSDYVALKRLKLRF